MLGQGVVRYVTLHYKIEETETLRDLFPLRCVWNQELFVLGLGLGLGSSSIGIMST